MIDIPALPAAALYRPREVQQILKISEWKFFNLAKKKQLATKKIGRSTVVEAAELQRFIASLPAGGPR
ncbi:MerR family transcriptional regulator [Acidocella facilis]|uniref:helix-turn-helix domain-containing protein n=1 Tax=Acidocella facilis TaxID=525 RepID=UPI001F38C398|nr:helix-turn-helix domain-containing protein [Acidocella facilis]